MNSILKRFKSWTNWLAILVAVSGNLPLVEDMLGEYYGVTSLVIAVLIVIMREKTTKPVSEK